MGFGIGSVVGGPMGILNDLSGGSANENKAKNKEVTKAAPRDTDQKRMWEDFMSYLYGTPSDKFDAEYYIKNNKDVADAYNIDVNNITEKDKKKAEQHYNRFGVTENRQPYDPATQVSDSYFQRLTEDTGYKQGNDQQLLSSILDTNSRTRENNQKYYDDLNQMVDQNRGLAGHRIELAGAGISGDPMQFMSRSAQGARNYVTGGMGTLNQIANANAALNTSGAQAVNQYRNAYTPNRVENEYMNYLQALNDRQDSLRYSTPTTTSTGTYNPGLLGTVGTLVGAAAPMLGAMGGGGGAGSGAGAAGAGAGMNAGGMVGGYAPGAFSLY